MGQSGSRIRASVSLLLIAVGLLTSVYVGAQPGYQPPGGGGDGGGVVGAGGPDKSVQFNDAGVFNGEAEFTWDKATNLLSIGADTSGGDVHLYNTFTNASNYERASLRWSSDELQLLNEAAGTGNADRGIWVTTTGNGTVSFGTVSIKRWQVTNLGHFVAIADNSYDIGASGATRPRDIFVADNLITGAATGGTNQVGSLFPGSVTHANLSGTATNGQMVYCSDCTRADPCAGSGNGALALRLNGAWMCGAGTAGGGGASPGGADTQVQFNDGGTFGGDGDFVWDKTNNILKLGATDTLQIYRDGTGPINFNLRSTGSATSARLLIYGLFDNTNNWTRLEAYLDSGTRWDIRPAVAGSHTPRDLAIYGGSGSLLLGGSGPAWKFDTTTQHFHPLTDNTHDIGVTGTGRPRHVVAASEMTAGCCLLAGPTWFSRNAGEIGMNRMTAAATAPGASGAKLAVLCGTNAGTGKLVMYVGTSSTPTTVIDNVGAGFSGC